MDSLRIARLRAQYRVPAPASAHKARLDALFAGSVRDGLEPALARAGVPVHEEICVRRVHARTRLRLSRPDGALALDWSLALAEELREVLARGGPDVVRYGSRAHALVDALTGATSDDLRRAWAWRQMGLWRAADGVPPASAAEHAFQALLREARAAAAVLAAVARLGALWSLVDRVADRSWSALAAAALEAVGASPALAVLEDAVRSGARTRVREADRARVVAVAAEVRARSALAAAVMGEASASCGRPVVRRALAVLAVLEVDPMALRGSAAAASMSVAEVEKLFAAASGAHAADAPPGALHRKGTGEGLDVAPAPSETARETDAAGRPLLEAGLAPEEGIPPPPSESPQEVVAPSRQRSAAAEDGAPREPRSAGAVAPRGVTLRERGPSDAPPEGTARGHREPPAEPRRTRSARNDDAEAERPLPEVRGRSRTRAGGLLFLLHLVEEADLPSRVPADGRLATRPWPWFLYRLAWTLLPDADEPATLAFAGLTPGAEPPDAGEPSAAEAERAALEEYRGLVMKALHRRLRRELPDPGLVSWTCLRAAEIVADPAWIEVHFGLDEACTEIRRSGLDRDPGWLPWLGTVVRFLYA